MHMVILVSKNGRSTEYAEYACETLHSGNDVLVSTGSIVDSSLHQNR